MWNLTEFSKNLDKSNRAIDILERFSVSQLVRLSTYLGPAVPAYFVYEAAKVYLTQNWGFAAFVIAFVLELLGLGVIYNLNGLFEWNRKYLSEPVPTAGAQWLVFFYAAQISVIVFGLKIYPNGFLWMAIFGLSSLSILTGFAYSQSQQHKARVEAKQKTEELAEQENEAKRKLDAELREERLRMELEIARMRAQSELEIERKKAEMELQAKLMKVEAKLTNPVQKSVKPSVKSDVQRDVKHGVNSGVFDTNLDTTEQRLNRLMDTLLDTGWQGASNAAKCLNVSRQTVYNDLAVLASRNLIRIGRSADGKITNVEIVAIVVELPEPVIHTNGHNHH